MSKDIINKSEILELLKKDFSPVEIAKKMNICKGTVYKCIIDNTDTKKLTQKECMVEIKELLKNGSSEKEISIKIRRPMQTTKQYIKQAISENQMEEAEEIKQTKQVKAKPKVYEKRIITYSGWHYRMLGTWRFKNVM